MENFSITEQSKALFVSYAKDACNWSGSPLVGGNVSATKQNAGNLTDLKKIGLITTYYDTYDRCTWLNFTQMGIEYAKSLGIDVVA